MRITGLSGLDTESWVKELMTAQRKSGDKLYQQKQLQNWKIDAYREVNTKILDLRNIMQDMRWSSAFNKSTTDSSNSGLVTATVTGTPTQSIYEISNVTLAKQATSANYTLNVGISGTETLSADQTITLNGTNITLTSGSKLSDIVTTINAAVDAAGVPIGIIAQPFEDGKSIVLTAAGTGTTSNLSIASATGAFGLSSIPITKQGVNAQTASVTINGATLNPTSNTFTYDGMKFELKDNDTSGTITTITQKKDTATIFDSIKKFVDTYNGIIDDLNKKVSERKNRDYLPLNDDQKEAMKDNDIEKWEAKAKEGLLGSDSIITNMLSKMRTATNTSVVSIDSSGTKTTVGSLTSIGIGLSDSWRDNGKLKIDETKLKAALETNLETVTSIFSKSTSNLTTSANTVQSTSKFDQSGVADRLYDQLEATIKELSEKALKGSQSIIGKQISQLDTRISDFEKRMTEMEDRYFRQFSAMETAMAKFNSQSGWMASQFGGGQ
jgi:flagellar hook-associated protein 2